MLMSNKASLEQYNDAIVHEQFGIKHRTLPHKRTNAY